MNLKKMQINVLDEYISNGLIRRGQGLRVVRNKRKRYLVPFSFQY